MSLTSINEQDEFSMPGRDLWATVLKLAIVDLKSDKEPLRRHAKRWFRDSAVGPGSLTWVCSILNINVDCARRMAYEIAKEKQSVEIPPVSESVVVSDDPFGLKALLRSKVAVNGAG